MGLGGYGPQQYLGTLRTVGLAAAPDLVLLCFYIGNDVTGIPTRHEVRHGELYSTSSSDPRLNLLRRSHLFAWLEKRFFFRQRRERAQKRRAAETEGTTAGSPALRSSESADRPAGPGPAPPAAPLTRLYLEVLRNRLPFYAASAPASMERLWREAEAHLDAVDRSCREAEVPWGLVIIPDEFQVDAAVREEAIRRLSAHGVDLDFDAPSRRLVSWATHTRVPVLDLLPLFREECARRGPLYIPSDTHWNKEGNRLAGEAVARFADDLPGWRARRGGASAPPEAERMETTTP